MDSPLFHVTLRIIVGIASLWCLVMAVTGYRATKEMQRTGNARRLPFPFPTDFMWLDLMLMAIRRNPRVPPALQEKYERIEFVTIINGNLLRAFWLLLFALLGALFAAGTPTLIVILFSSSIPPSTAFAPPISSRFEWIQPHERITINHAGESFGGLFPARRLRSLL